MKNDFSYLVYVTRVSVGLTHVIRLVLLVNSNHASMI